MPELGIPYEIVGPDGTRAIVGNSTAARADPDFVGYLDQENGITGIGESDVREDADVLTDRDGGEHGDFFRGRMPIVVQGVLDPNADIGTVNLLEAKLRRAIKALREDGTLSWTPTGGVRRQVTFRMQQPMRVAGRLPKTFQASLVSASHRVVAASESNASFAAGGTGGEVGFAFPLKFPLSFAFNTTGAVQIANQGDESYPPRFRIDGPISNPTVRNGTTGEELRLTTTLAAGDWLDIYVDSREVLLNGTTDRYSTVQFPGSTWWDLQPGANDVRLLANSYSSPAALTVYWRSAWA